MDELIARISKVPFAQRVLVLALVVVLIVVLCYVIIVSPKEEEKKRYETRIEKLDGELFQKKNIARNLPRYRVEVARLEQKLNQALTLLPNEAEIPELLQKIAALVEQSDCEMATFEPQGEVVSEFYAKIPVKMAIAGNYHSIAVFFDKVSKLTRIVNISEIQLSSPKLENKKVVLEAQFLATTFKFVERKEDAKTGTGFKNSSTRASAR